MKHNVVVDASVVVKWVLPEANRQAAIALLARVEASEVTPYVPELLFAEATNAVWKQVALAKRMNAGDAADAINAILESPLRVEPMSNLMIPAFEIALGTGCTVYDAVYVALAERLDATLVTADAKLFNRLKSSRYAELIIAL